MYFSLSYNLKIEKIFFDVQTPTIGSVFQVGIVLSYNDSTKNGLIISLKDLDSNLTWLEVKIVCDTSTLNAVKNKVKLLVLDRDITLSSCV